MPFSFQNLKVYQAALIWADEALKISQHLTESKNRVLSDQLSRAATAIPLNIAEGNGRWHKAEKRQFFWIARGSAFECVSILEISRRRNLITPECEASSTIVLESISKMLSSLIKSTDSLT